MKVKDLKDCYDGSEVAKAFFDHMAARTRNQSETKVHRIQDLLADEGFGRSDIIQLFRDMDKIGCGQFVTGRHGWPSRFVWSVGSVDAARLACGESEEIETFEDVSEDTSNSSETAEYLKHRFNLRPDVVIEISLPNDLTEKEAERLSLFMKSLPMEEYD